MAGSQAPVYIDNACASTSTVLDLVHVDLLVWRLFRSLRSNTVVMAMAGGLR